MEHIFFYIIFISIIGLIVLGVFKKRFDVLINYLLRIVTGLVSIYVLNTLLNNMGLDIAVGSNSFTAFLMGVLGLPGFIMMYGIAIYFYFV